MMKALITLMVCVVTVLCGCTTSSYKAAGVVVVTVDRASDGWLDYYARAKRLADTDLVKLEKQDQQVWAAYVKYQAAMETIYHARLVGTAKDINEAGLAAAKISTEIVNLVMQFLPTNEANKLKSL